MPRGTDLYELVQLLSIALDHPDASQDEDCMKNALRSFQARAYQVMQDICGALGYVPYPFEHAREGMTLRDSILDQVPDSQDTHGVLAEWRV